MTREADGHRAAELGLEEFTQRYFELQRETHLTSISEEELGLAFDEMYHLVESNPTSYLAFQNRQQRQQAAGARISELLHDESPVYFHRGDSTGTQG